MGRAHIFKRHAVSSHFQVSNLDTICVIYVYVCVVVVDDVVFALLVPIASFFLMLACRVPTVVVSFCLSVSCRCVLCSVRQFPTPVLTSAKSNCTFCQCTRWTAETGPGKRTAKVVPRERPEAWAWHLGMDRFSSSMPTKRCAVRPPCLGPIARTRHELLSFSTRRSG